MSRRKINRCVECKTPLKHIDNNKWMCDQSPTNCKMSIKVIFLNNPAERERSIFSTKIKVWNELKRKNRIFPNCM